MLFSLNVFKIITRLLLYIVIKTLCVYKKLVLNCHYKFHIVQKKTIIVVFALSIAHEFDLIINFAFMEIQIQNISVVWMRVDHWYCQ